MKAAQLVAQGFEAAPSTDSIVRPNSTQESSTASKTSASSTAEPTDTPSTNVEPSDAEAPSSDAVVTSEPVPMTTRRTPRSESSTEETTSESEIPIDPERGLLGDYQGDIIEPPAQPWSIPSHMTQQFLEWLGWVMYVGLALSILSIMLLGAMMILDRGRGEPISAADPQVTAMRIAVGLFFITAAASLATFFS